jgi:ferric-dicitrate binding protein FerR (iron transport regulator)
MNTKFPYALLLACALSLSISLPMETVAAPDAGAGTRAGEVSRVIPAVSIARGAKNMSASAKTVVDWQDVVKTEASGRARVSLDDGSVLNVGSASTLTVVKHDAGAQQTDLEIGFGKIRAQAQKISQPNGKFEVHTPAGVAGVVGTDFYVDYENNMMTVIVYEGIVRVCNLAGVCVEVKAGQMTTVRKDDASAPAAQQATLATLTDAVNSTLIEGPSGGVQVHHIGKGTAITLGILAVVPIIVIPVVVSHSGTTTPTPVTNGCKPTQVGSCG